MTKKNLYTCPKCMRGLSKDEANCPTCGTTNSEADKEAVKFRIEIENKLANVILTTGISIEGKPVKEYKGIISAEMVLGLSIIRDIGATFADFLGGRATGYEKKIREAKEDLLNKLKYEAMLRDANAVIGIDMDYQELRGSMIMLSINGTAIKT